MISIELEDKVKNVIRTFAVVYCRNGDRKIKNKEKFWDDITVVTEEAK